MPVPFSNWKLLDPPPHINLDEIKIKTDSHVNVLNINLDLLTHAHQVATATNRLIYLLQKVKSYINVQFALKFYTTYIHPRAKTNVQLFINVLATFITQLKATYMDGY